MCSDKKYEKQLIWGDAGLSKSKICHTFAKNYDQNLCISVIQKKKILKNFRIPEFPFRLSVSCTALFRDDHNTVSCTPGQEHSWRYPQQRIVCFVFTSIQSEVLNPFD